MHNKVLLLGVLLVLLGLLQSLYLTILEFTAACPTGEYEETPSGKCRYEYNGVHYWGMQSETHRQFLQVDRNDNYIFQRQSFRFFVTDEHKLFFIAANVPPSNGLVEIQTNVKVKSIMQDDPMDFYKMPLVLSTDGQAYKVDIYEGELLGPLPLIHMHTREQDTTISPP